MKTILVSLFALALFSTQLNAQDRTFKAFKVDVSAGYAVPQGTGSKGGVCFAIEPKYAIMDQLAVGLRMEAAVTARGLDIDEDADELSGTVSANASYLATCDYYFMNDKFRPFAGVGFGFFQLASTDFEVDGTDVGSIPTDSKFGAMMRAGFEAGHFRMGAEYNFVGKSDYLGENIKNGYFSIKIGVCIGGGRK